MGHAIRALVAPPPVLVLAKARVPVLRIATLPQGLGLIPLSDDSLDAVHAVYGGSVTVPGFVQLVGGIVTCASELSLHSPVVYLETEYSGGTGGQAAAVFRTGAVALAHSSMKTLGAPRTAHGHVAINVALRELGVVKGDSLDEFAAVGLHRHRRTSDWEAVAT
jgi:hypothetical protein